MNTIFKSINLLGVLGALLLCSPHCEASTIDIDLVQTTQTDAPGITLVFSGVLTNATGSTVFLNSAGINLAGGFLPADFDVTPFLVNAPLSLEGTQGTGAIDLFTVTIPNSFGDGLYAGTFAVLGGADANAQEILGTANFFVGVAGTDAPEPSTMWTVAVTLAASAMVLRRRNHPRIQIRGSRYRSQ